MTGERKAIGIQHVVEELENVVRNYPVFLGDTISHETARRAAERGWIVRNADGDWIPTRKGILALQLFEDGDAG